MISGQEASAGVKPELGTVRPLTAEAQCASRVLPARQSENDARRGQQCRRSTHASDGCRAAHASTSTGPSGAPSRALTCDGRYQGRPLSERDRAPEGLRSTRACRCWAAFRGVPQAFGRGKPSGPRSGWCRPLGRPSRRCSSDGQEQSAGEAVASRRRKTYRDGSSANGLVASTALAPCSVRHNPTESARGTPILFGEFVQVGHFLRGVIQADAHVSSESSMIVDRRASMHRCIRPVGLNWGGGKARVSVC
jgi:hypothetical protein